MKLQINTTSLPFLDKLKPLLRFKLVAFIILVAGLSGYLVLQINSALNVTPAEQAQVSVKKSPRIDPALVTQLQNLQDNSVSVRALFNEARENPFQ